MQATNGFNALVSLVCHAGLLALYHGQHARAATIFAGVRPCMRDPDALDVSQAIVHYVRREFTEAERLLADVLSHNPAHEVATATLGFVYRACGRESDGARQFEQIMAVGVHPRVRQVAAAALAA